MADPILRTFIQKIHFFLKLKPLFGRLLRPVNFDSEILKIIDSEVTSNIQVDGYKMAEFLYSDHWFLNCEVPFNIQDGGIFIFRPLISELCGHF